MNWITYFCNLFRYSLAILELFSIIYVALEEEGHFIVDISTMTNHVKVNSSNPFLYCPFVNALSLSITTNPYFYCQQQRHSSQKSSYDMSMFTWSLYTCFRLVPSCLDQQICIIAYALVSLHTFDRYSLTDRSSRRSHDGSLY